MKKRNNKCQRTRNFQFKDILFFLQKPNFPVKQSFLRYKLHALSMEQLKDIFCDNLICENSIFFGLQKLDLNFLFLKKDPALIFWFA